MQYLTISKDETLLSISRIVGQRNTDLLLAENGIDRSPRPGKAWAGKCDNIVATTKDVTPSRKAALLNNLTDSEEIFEKACLLDDSDWKIFSETQAFRDAIKVPESIKLPSSSRVIGTAAGNVTAANIGSVSPVTYKAVMNDLKNTGTINPGIFNDVNTSIGLKLASRGTVETQTSQYAFNIPWGKVQLYSSLLDDLIDFPAYPEQLEQGRSATYTSMPDIIYQYEPWIVYQSSGPREQSISFHLHRDMWSGNHLDGKANKLIRFCEANTFPEYSGSAVIPPYVRMYIDGSLFISGVLTATNVTWSGPLGQDNWYLEFNLSLSIQEVSESKLDVHSVAKRGLKEG